MLMNKGYFPEILNNFHLYVGAESGGEMLLGMTNSVTMPNLEMISETVSGSGIAGEINVPNPGHFPDVQMEIPFVAVCRDMFSFNPLERTMLTMRACEQSTVKATGNVVTEGMKVVVGGRCTGYNIGTAEIGKQMNSSVTLSLSYIKIEVSGEVLFELDKYNEVFIVGGVDVMADIKSKC